MGAHYINDETEAGRMVVKLNYEDMVFPPDFGEGEYPVHHDIALVKLPEAVEMNEMISPVCLPTQG